MKDLRDVPQPSLDSPLASGRALVLLAIFLAIPSGLTAGPLGVSAFATGRSDVTIRTNDFLAPAATGDVCAYAEAGGTVAGPANRTVPPPPPSVNCGVAFTSSPLSTLGILQPGQAINAVPKFPAPFGTGAFSGIGLTIASPNLTTSTASATWNSTEAGIIFVDRSARMNARARVTNAGPKPPGGTAASESTDPWFFSFSSDTLFDLTVDLFDVELTTQTVDPGGALAGIEAVGALGSGSQVGQNVIASWAFASLVENNNSSTPPAMILFDEAIPLRAGSYWLTAELRTVARVAPEPASLLMVLVGLGAAAFRKRSSL